MALTPRTTARFPAGALRPNGVTDAELAASIATAIDSEVDARTAADQALGALITELELTNVTPFPLSQDRFFADRSYYVRPDGSDSNNGLTNTSGGAFFTIQKAIDTAHKADFNNFACNVFLADGTYDDFDVYGRFINDSQPNPLIIEGNLVTPGNVIILGTSDHALDVRNGARAILRGVTFRAITSGNGITAQNHATVRLDRVKFLDCIGDMISPSYFSHVVADGPIQVAGNSNSLVHATNNSIVQFDNQTITLTGTPGFAVETVGLNTSVLTLTGTTFTGAATGVRFLVHKMSMVDTNGGGINFIPGNVAGTTVGASGGIYL